MGPSMSRLFVTVAVCSLIAGLVLLPSPASTQELTLSLDSLGMKIDVVERRIAQEHWQLLVRGESDSLAFYTGLRRSVLTDDRVFDQLHKAGSSNGDEQDSRRFELLYEQLLSARLSYGAGLYPLYDSLADYFGSVWPRLQGVPQTTFELSRTLLSANQRSEREAAYRALSSPDELRVDQLGRLIRQRNQAAKRMGYNDCFRLLLSSRGLRANDYSELIELVDAVTAPIYDSLLLGLQTAQTSGGLEIWDWTHSYANDIAAIDAFFPVDSQIDILKRSLSGIGFDLDALPVYLHLAADSGLPQAQLLIVDIRNDIRIVHRLVDGVQGMRELLGTCGQALYAAHVAQEHPTYTRLLEPEVLLGVGYYFRNLALQPGWLETYAGVPSSVIQRFLSAERSLDALRLRLLLVNAAFEAEAYANPNQDLNQVYWRLFEKYLSLPRHDDLTPWASDVNLVTNPLNARDVLVARILARQSARHLHELYGEPVNNRDIRAFMIQNYFRFGSRYPWRELLERATGKPTDPQSLVAFWE